jgi:hypothetical protein
VRARIAATVVLAAGILIGTSGCNLFAPQATTIHYDPSDGVGGDVGQVDVRNALLISTDGENANLVATLVNRGDSSYPVVVQYDGTSGRVSEEITVPAKSRVQLGADGGPSVTLRDVDAQPGSLFPVFFQYGEETGTELLVPVLENNLSEYSTLTPSPEPTRIPEPAPTTAPTTEPTAEPTTEPAP